MQYKITITGTKPIWFGTRKVLPGQDAIVEGNLIDRSNRHIVIDKVIKPITKRRKKSNGVMESKRSNN